MEELGEGKEPAIERAHPLDESTSKWESEPKSAKLMRHEECLATTSILSKFVTHYTNTLIQSCMMHSTHFSNVQKNEEQQNVGTQPGYGTPRPLISFSLIRII